MNRRILLTAISLLAVTAAAGCTDTSSDESEDLAEAEQADIVCPAGQIVEGIDVSVWQADIDWESVKAAGVQYAFARAAYSTSKDDYFDQNWAGMKAAGVIRGAYQYWRPDKDPIAQADALLAIMGPLEPGDLPPVIDVEETDGVGPVTLTDRLGQWLQHVEAAIGRKPIIYSGKYFWQDNVQSKAFLDYPYWIPNYSLECPNLPNGYWPDWQFFQYTSTGHVNGVSGNVDRDQWNGTLQDLQAFAGGGPKYGAKFVSQSFPYAADGAVQMLAGSAHKVSLTLKNTGTEPWNENTRLGTTEPRDRESAFAGAEWPGKNRFAQVQGQVLPGEDYTFEWLMHAPSEAGLYDEHIGLVQEGVAWFSDSGQGGPPDGQLEGLFQVGAKYPFGSVDNGDRPGQDFTPGMEPPASGDDTPDPKTTQKASGCSVGGAQDPSAPAGLWTILALSLVGSLARRKRVSA